MKKKTLLAIVLLQRSCLTFLKNFRQRRITRGR